MILFAGDVNWCFGNKKDYIDNVDDLRDRHILDANTNQHGQAFIDYLLETKMCILNGRFNKDHDGFTSISSKGTAVSLTFL